MISSPLIQTLNYITPISKEIENYIISSLREDKFNKRDILLKEGQIARRIYFIQKGFCRAYYIKEDEEYTTWFMGESDIMISVFSFFTRQPAVETVEVLEDSVLLSMSWEQLQKLYTDYPDFNLVGRIITEQYYIKSEERAIALRTLSAKNRYENLLKTYPNILQKASLGQIASHLGMKLETLSRIRAKITF